MPKVLIAVDKFKGSLSALEACECIAKGLGVGVDSESKWDCDICPIADGGEGFTEAMIHAAAGEWVECLCDDALGREVTASYGVIPSGGKKVAVMEMAAASGMWRISPAERDVMRASTVGVGQMIIHATQVAGVHEILIGIGGSATNDGGAGMAEALGVRFFDQNNQVLKGCPQELQRLARIETNGMMALPPIRVACDVENPLFGPNGASHVYGPQKGASAAQVVELDQILRNMAQLSGHSDCATYPGAGAAGGLGFGLMAYTGAELRSGFSLVAEALDLPARIRSADVIITGEGSLDAQSLNGKGPIGVAQLTKKLGKTCIGFAGRIESRERLSPYFDDLSDIVSLGHGVENSMQNAKQYLQRIVSLWNQRDHG